MSQYTLLKFEYKLSEEKLLQSYLIGSRLCPFFFALMIDNIFYLWNTDEIPKSYLDNDKVLKLLCQDFYHTNRERNTFDNSALFHCSWESNLVFHCPPNKSEMSSFMHHHFLLQLFRVPRAGWPMYPCLPKLHSTLREYSSSV